MFPGHVCGSEWNLVYLVERRLLVSGRYVLVMLCGVGLLTLMRRVEEFDLADDDLHDTALLAVAAVIGIRMDAADDADSVSLLAVLRYDAGHSVPCNAGDEVGLRVRVAFGLALVDREGEVENRIAVAEVSYLRVSRKSAYKLYIVHLNASFLSINDF